MRFPPRKIQSNFLKRLSTNLTSGVRLAIACGILCLVGCVSSQKKLIYFNKPNDSYYKESAAKIEFPEVFVEPNLVVDQSDAPRTVVDPGQKEIWDMPLAEAIHLALVNSEVIKRNAEFLSDQNSLLSNPLGVNSKFDPAIQETGVLLGNRGVEAALADFDTQFTTSMLWGRSEEAQNTFASSGGIGPLGVLSDETASFTTRLQKQTTTGGTVAVSHNWNYSNNNTEGFQMYGSAYQGSLRTEFRQPLGAGFGTEFTRIAGPIGSSLSGLSGVSQGVVISRINNDITLVNLEKSIINLVRETEELYWDLALAYRSYDSQKQSQGYSYQLWRTVKTLQDTGSSKGSATEEAQARDNYLLAKNGTQSALSDLYETEDRLRRLLGLPTNDGRLIRPTTEPNLARIKPNWELAKRNAIAHRPEIRQAKWQIKSLELQYKAAKSLVRPRFDFVSSYQVNAFGDHLLEGDNRQGVGVDRAERFRNAYESLTEGSMTGWNLGFEFSVPIGQRAAHTQKNNIELQLLKMRKSLAAMEVEITHELASAFQRLDREYQLAQVNFGRRKAAQDRFRAERVAFEAAQTTLDALVRSRTNMVLAEVEFYRSVASYNRTITELFYRQGVLLQEYNIRMAEGAWDMPAYADADRRAIERAHAWDDVDHSLHSAPLEFVGAEPAVLPTHVPQPKQKQTPSVPQKVAPPVKEPELGPTARRITQTGRIVPVPAPPVPASVSPIRQTSGAELTESINRKPKERNAAQPQVNYGGWKSHE